MRTRWTRFVMCMMGLMLLYRTPEALGGEPGAMRIVLRDGTSITSVISQPIAITIQPCVTLTYARADTLAAVVDLSQLNSIVFVPCSEVPTSVQTPTRAPVTAELRATISPNPATNGALIEVMGVKESTVSVQVVDMGGRVVRRFAPQSSVDGRVQLEWDTHEESGRQLPSATYMVVISTDTGKIFQMLQLLR